MLKRLLNMFFPMFTDSSTREKPTLNSQVDQKPAAKKVEPKIKTAKAKLKPVAAPKKKRGRPPKAKK